MNPVRGKKPTVSASLAMPSWTSNGMKLRALLFGVGFMVAMALPAIAVAQGSSTTTSSTSTPPAPRPACILRASQTAVELGKTVNLSWESRYATEGFITSIGTVGIDGVQGVIPVAPATTYVGTFTGPGGTGTCGITISILQPSGGGDGGTIEGPGTVPPPDKLPPTPGGSAPPPLPPASDITFSNTQSTGLIPCGDTTGKAPNTPEYYAAATSCQICHLASLAQKIINFLLGLSIPLAAAMFAYAGVIYFSSSVVDKLDKAHAVFKSVGIGFMLVLCAWLGVQTVLKTVLKESYYQNWNRIDCVQDISRPRDKTIKDMLSTLPLLSTFTPAPSSFSDRFAREYSAPTPSCTGEGYMYSSDTGKCWNPETGESMPPTFRYSSSVSNPEMAAQIATACSQYGMGSSECALASGIAMRESSGGRDCRTSPTGAAGCMQVLATTACELNPSIDGCAGCAASRRSLSAECAPVIQAVSSDLQLGTSLGIEYFHRLYQQYGGSCQLAAAAYFQGPGKVKEFRGVPPLAYDYVSKTCR